MTDILRFGSVVRSFFADYLIQQKRVSPQTVAAYRDAVRLLLGFLHTHRQLEPDQVQIGDLDAAVILAFLDDLETTRHNTARSRNARLAALRTLARFIAFRWPEHLERATRILAIPRKRTARPLVGFLTRDEMDAVLRAPDRTTWIGRRDHALLLTLYNTGARVSELIAVRRPHVTFGVSTSLQLLGKGRKERRVPLWGRTARGLRAWFDELGDTAADLAFPNAQGARLTRQGVAYLLHEVVTRARASCPSLTTKRVSPHVVRHTTAMHLLQAGVDLATIALWLGHERLETTHLYLAADLAMKERALHQLDPLGAPARRFKADRSILAFLGSL